MAKKDTPTPKTPNTKSTKVTTSAKEACKQSVDTPAPTPLPEVTEPTHAAPCGIDTLPVELQTRFKEILEQSKASRSVDEFDAEDAKTIIAALDVQGMSYERQTEIIVDKFKVVRELAKALHDMHDSKLYLLYYKSFEDYVEATCSYSRARAYQLIYADELIARVDKEVGQNIIVNEYQTRALRRLKNSKDDEENIKEQIDLVKALKDKEGKVTVQKINEAIDEIMAKAQSAHAPAYQTTLKKISTRYLNNFQRLYGNTPAIDKGKMKEEYIKALSALIEQVRGHSGGAKEEEAGESKEG